MINILDITFYDTDKYIKLWDETLYTYINTNNYIIKHIEYCDVILGTEWQIGDRLYLVKRESCYVLWNTRTRTTRMQNSMGGFYGEVI